MLRLVIYPNWLVKPSIQQALGSIPVLHKLGIMCTPEFQHSGDRSRRIRREGTSEEKNGENEYVYENARRGDKRVYVVEGVMRFKKLL